MTTPRSCKLDENMPADAADIVRAAGLDCHTVFDEHLAGRPDGELSAACLAERRILLTLGSVKFEV